MAVCRLMKALISHEQEQAALCVCCSHISGSRLPFMKLNLAVVGELFSHMKLFLFIFSGARKFSLTHKAESFKIEYAKLSIFIPVSVGLYLRC